MINPKAIILFLFSVVMINNAKSQGVNNLWLLGYSDSSGYPWGAYNLDFTSNQLLIDTVGTHRKIDMGVTNSTIADTAGNLLFCTNGYFIADATGDTMLNGSGINPSWYTSQNPDGLVIPQANLILKKPNTNNIYYLFHSTVDYVNYSTALYLYLTTVDMNLNNGLGAVISKNQVLINDTLNVGKITACRHANGRDWWVVCHRAWSDIFYTMLVTSDSIYGPYSQHVGTFRPYDIGGVCFSPDGNYFAYYYTFNGLDVFSFDRCSGVLSLKESINPNDTLFAGSVAFSPNSKLLYVTAMNYVYQFDVTASNIAATQTTVAVYDSFLAPLETLFNLAQLAPDGKIYISTGNSTFHLHVINQPDSAGAACDFVQHGIQLPYYYFNSLPNHPNYFLGREIGSPCDTITVWFGLEEQSSAIQIKIYPNPSSGLFNLNFPVQSVSGVCEIYDVNSKTVFKESVAQWSQFKRIDITNEANGIYFVKMSWSNGVVGSVKKIKE